MKIYLGSDHNGYYLKSKIKDFLNKEGFEVFDDGDEKLDPNDDFPVFASKVVNNILSSDDSDPRGILLCGSGQGMCMAANRYKGIRAALVWDVASARASRSDDDSNILCIPARLLNTLESKASTDVFEIIRAWLKTPFTAAPRFIRRIKEMDQLT